MNILGISGSPNESGNTAYAIRYALEILLIWLAKPALELRAEASGTAAKN